MHQNADILLRPPEQRDLPAVVALDAESGIRASRSYWRDRFARCADGAEGHFLVADQAGTCVGFVVGEVRAWEYGSPPSGWIFAIGVRESLRERKVGTLLFDAICAEFRAAGVQLVRTLLSTNDVLVMSFFRGQGMMAGPFIQLEKSLEPRDPMTRLP